MLQKVSTSASLLASSLKMFLITAISVITLLVLIIALLSTTFIRDLLPYKENPMVIEPYHGISFNVPPSPWNSARTIESPKFKTPEDLEIGSSGLIYTGTQDGRIITIEPFGSRQGNQNEANIDEVEEKTYRISDICSIGTTRILGLKLSNSEKFLYFASLSGIWMADLTSNKCIRLFADYEGKPLLVPNSVAISTDDQTIYFTESSTVFPLSEHTKDVVLKNPNGRLFEYHLASKKLKLLATHLHFPNGIVYKPSTESLLVAQTSIYQISQYSIKGAKVKVLTRDLPGYADNMKLDHKTGSVWVGMVLLRDPLSYIVDKYPSVRRIFALIPQSIINVVSAWKCTGAIRINSKSGAIERQLIGTAKKALGTTVVNIHNGILYAGHLISSNILMMKE